MRGATSRRAWLVLSNLHFNPRSSCEERLDVIDDMLDDAISIHAPHARSDNGDFLSGTQQDAISIHAPHARSDVAKNGQYVKFAFQSTLLMRGATSSSLEKSGTTDFNPRSSCEERPNFAANCKRAEEFQSTLLMRGATQSQHSSRLSIRISIHAPHARSDSGFSVV